MVSFEERIARMESTGTITPHQAAELLASTRAAYRRAERPVQVFAYVVNRDKKVFPQCGDVVHVFHMFFPDHRDEVHVPRHPGD